METRIVVTLVVLVLGVLFLGLKIGGEYNMKSVRLCALESNYRIEHNAEFGYRVVPIVRPFINNGEFYYLNGYFATDDSARSAIQKTVQRFRRMWLSGDKWTIVQ